MQKRIVAITHDAFSASENRIVPVSSWAVIRVLCSGVLTVIAPFVAFFFIVAIVRGYSWQDYLWLIGGLTTLMLFEAFLGMLLSRQLPAHADDAGITSTDLWGRRLSLAWSEIKTVQATQYLKLPYLQIESFGNDNAVLWLPLYLQSPQELSVAVARSTAPNNPLRRFLEEKYQTRQ